MPIESAICRAKLDEERGNPQICQCPMCRGKGKKDGEILDCQGSGGEIETESTDCISLTEEKERYTSS